MLPLLSVLLLAAGLHQPAVPVFDVTSCKGSYSDDDYEAMTQVREVAEARVAFPASYMFAPRDEGTHPGMLLLHGSEGGRWSVLSMCDARWYAAHGFVAMFLCYSDCGNDALPEAIHMVDLGRTYDALQYVKNSPYVAGRKVALTGGSRGAEQALVLATFLARHSSTGRARAGEPVSIPDAVYVHAPFGRIVGDFNWRWDAADWRWARWIRAKLACLRDDPNGPYVYTDQTGILRHLAWIPDNADLKCSVRPALSNEDCRDYSAADGPYTDPATHRRYSWREDLCGVGGDPAGDWRVGQAWTWRGDASELATASEIPLQQYQGPLLVAQGMDDDVWSIGSGTKWLEATLGREGIRFDERVFPQWRAVPSPLPELPDTRVTFTIYDGEHHGFGPVAAEVERTLELRFLERTLH